MTATQTLPDIFFKKSKELAGKRAFYYCNSEDLKWVDMSWSTYAEHVGILAGWLLAKGIKKGDKVAILSGNRPEWLISDLAIMSIGAISVPIYATSSEKDITYIIEHSGSKILIVDDLDRTPCIKGLDLETIVALNRAPRKKCQGFRANIVFYADLLKEKAHKIEANLELDSDDISSIIYTSGTTGLPKGVVHTHGTFAAAIKSATAALGSNDKEVDRFFSFLPLSHVAERVLVEFGSVATGSEVAFARSIDTLGEDLVRCRPTILLCVPRLWEKIYEKINAGLLLASPLKKKLFKLAKHLGENRIDGQSILKSKNNSWRSKVSDMLVGKKLRNKLGLDRCRMYLTGSAPTRPEVVRFFGSFGLQIREVYGLTENLCLGVFSPEDETIMGSCGHAFEGNDIKIASDGEILFKAPWIFKGYYKNPEATEEALINGWLATGDLGVLDEKGGLKIVGRKKELLKTSGGKYVAPVPIEDSLKATPLVQDAIVVGDDRKYCVALVTLDPDIALDPGAADHKELLSNHLSNINKPLASYATIKRMGVIKRGLSVDAGNLTPSLKIKRNVVHSQNQEFIETLYKSEESVVFEI